MFKYEPEVFVQDVLDTELIDWAATYTYTATPSEQDKEVGWFETEIDIFAQETTEESLLDQLKDVFRYQETDEVPMNDEKEIEKTIMDYANNVSASLNVLFQKEGFFYFKYGENLNTYSLYYRQKRGD